MELRLGGRGGEGVVFVPVYIQYTYKPIAIAVFKMRGVGRVVINHLFYGVLLPVEDPM